jgi:hypothetical protein
MESNTMSRKILIKKNKRMKKIHPVNDIKLQDFFNHIREEIKKENKELFQRSTKIQLEEVYIFKSKVLGSQKSYDIVIDDMVLNDQLNFSKEAMRKKTNTIPVEILEKINNNISKYTYGSEKGKIFAVDGTISYLPKSFVNEEFPLTQNNESCKILHCGIVDTSTKIPIDYHLQKNYSERLGFLEQLEKLHEILKDNILIFDRGYYSIKILFELYNHDTNCLFRLKNNILNKELYKRLDNENDIVIDMFYQGNPIPFRVLKYDIENKRQLEPIYLGTTLLDKNTYSKDKLLEMYRKRWEIETNFRYAKYQLRLLKIPGLSELRIRQFVEIIKFVMMISFFIKSILEDSIDDKRYKINTNKCIYHTWKYIVPLILNRKNETLPYNKIKKVIKRMLVGLIKQVPNRHYSRIRKTPPPKFRVSGTTSNRPHIKKIKHQSPKEKEMDDSSIRLLKKTLLENIKQHIKVINDNIS